MTWATFEAGVKAAVSACLPSATRALTAINWADNAQEVSATRIILSVTSELEEMVREGTVHDGELSSSHAVVVQVLAESQHADPDIGARQLLELVRLGLRRHSIQNELAEAGLRLTGSPMNPRRLPYKSDGRIINAWAFDVAFRTIFVLAADPSDDFGLIEHVHVSGVVEDPDGDEIEVEEFDVDDTELEP